MNKCAVRNARLKEQLTHFTILNCAGNVGRSLGDNLIQGLPIGNTEEKDEQQTPLGKTVLKTNIRKHTSIEKNKKRNGGKPMNKYQSSLLTWLVGISYATRKL